jgi:hypothetical protein
MNATELFEAAASNDSTIHFRQRLLPALRRRRVAPRPFSRHALFDGMATARINLFSGLNLLQRPSPDPQTSIIDGLRAGIGRSEQVRIQAGPSRCRYQVSVPTLMDRWESRRALVSVTDLHIRGTRLETIIDTSSLSDFNLLCTGSGKMAREEMMTMVVSSAGNVTESHSDDPDGSNHCFVGRKLWLAWDTFEGLARGLDDCERRPVIRSTAFDLEVFLSLKSSRWFVVSPGQTLFLPGHLTHRVITLERYLGVGSFYVSLPNCIRTIARWTLRGPLWSMDDHRGEYAELIGEIAAAAGARIRHLRRASRTQQAKWGLSFVNRPSAYWERMFTRNDWSRVIHDTSFAALLQAASAPAR